MDSWVMLGQSKMMSRPVSIGTGVREIIGGSVQAVFAAGGTLILLDPFAVELRIQHCTTVSTTINQVQHICKIAEIIFVFVSFCILMSSASIMNDT